MNNIKKNILIFGFTSVLIGCSQSATSVFEKDAIYAQNVQYSKVIKSVEKETINGLFNITYLNSTDKEQWNNNNQNFLVGTYVFDNNEDDFKIYLNDKKAISSQIIKKDNPLYKNIAFRNDWAKYKIISFSNVQNKTLTIKYTHPTFNTISTTFTKE
ncbi:hypothetical protein OAR97_04905 [Arcobacteraceae bacterium]|nr:hypothetical protein [Arcobacteraceae bacterium]